jgi:hypothetical protein
MRTEKKKLPSFDSAKTIVFIRIVLDVMGTGRFDG